jgi:hypothetical protein
MLDPFAERRSGVRDRRVAVRRAGRMRRLALLAGLAGVAACSAPIAVAAAQTPSEPLAHASSARAKAALASTYVKEEGRLRFTSKGGGSAIVEQGYGYGTFRASIQIGLTIGASHVTGWFVAYLKGGSISGYTSATPHFSGSKYVSFKGSLTIKHGTGHYKGASGTAALYGAINRSNYQLAVQVIGRLRL